MMTVSISTVTSIATDFQFPLSNFSRAALSHLSDIFQQKLKKSIPVKKMKYYKYFLKLGTKCEIKLW